MTEICNAYTELNDPFDQRLVRSLAYVEEEMLTQVSASRSKRIKRLLVSHANKTRAY